MLFVLISTLLFSEYCKHALVVVCSITIIIITIIIIIIIIIISHGN